MYIHTFFHVDLRDYPEDEVAPEIASFKAILKEAVAAGEREENYGQHFFPLFKLSGFLGFDGEYEDGK